MQKILLAWSGGKDSAMALYTLQQNPDVEVVALLTTVTRDDERISMHKVRYALLQQQAEALGLPLTTVFISRQPSNAEYEQAMHEAMTQYKAQGVTAVAFGDLFLEDIRRYREEKLAPLQMACLFPLWLRDTGELAHEFIELGFKALISCADSRAGTAAFAGREFDAQLLRELPEGCDPCFENGECHSFVYDGPIFHAPVQVVPGEVTVRDGRFYDCDLIPVLLPNDSPCHD